MSRRISNARSSTRIRATEAGYRSGFEHEVALQAEKDTIEVEYEPASARVSYTTKVRTYTPDFVLANGIIIETKGRLTVHDRTKHKLIKEQHPLLDIRFVFQYDNPIVKGSKTKYSDWAEKHGFKWAIRYIPKKWAREPRTQTFDNVINSLYPEELSK